MNKTLKHLLEHASLVDVRTPEEFFQGHYPGAVNIPLDKVADRIEEFKEMHAPIVLYCRSGKRSAVATAILKQNGIDEVYNGGALTDLLKQKNS